MLVAIFISCDYGADKYPTPKDYDINHPVIVELPSELNEISGIVYYPKDTSVFAISDATGSLYKIFPNRGVEVQKWKFGKNHDYEDLQLVDSTFYILSSSGDIEKLKFSQEGPANVEEIQFPEGKQNEFESLYYDSTSGSLNLICKNCKHEAKDEISVWSLDLSTQNFTLATLKVNYSSLEQKFGKKKFEFKPSAAAINPLTNELFILSSINKLLVIADKDGMIKNAYPLDPAVYKQPEGIAFTPKGDLLISNESADTGPANILILKYKKKHQ